MGRSTASTASTVRTAHATRTTRSSHRGVVRAARRQRRTGGAGTELRPVVVLLTGTRLTRRGRLVVLVGLVALLLTAFSLGRSTEAATTTTPTPAVTQTTVQAGETLWTVAQRVAPGSDPRNVVQQLRRMNHLPSSGIQAGQQLLLPA